MKREPIIPGERSRTMTFDYGNPPTTRDDFLAAAIRANTETPNGRFREGWALGPVGQHRDSNALARSNFRIALRELLLAAEMSPDDLGFMPRQGPEVEDHRPLFIGHFGHWAVGWVEELIWRADDPRMVDAAFSLWERLLDYPILDEMDFSEEEWEENHPAGDDFCYAKGFCECDRRSSECGDDSHNGRFDPCK